MPKAAVAAHCMGTRAVSSLRSHLQSRGTFDSRRGCFTRNPHLQKSRPEGIQACGSPLPCHFFTASVCPLFLRKTSHSSSIALPVPALPPSSPHHFSYGPREFTTKDTLKTSRGLGSRHCTGLAAQLPVFHGLLRTL